MPGTVANIDCRGYPAQDQIEGATLMAAIVHDENSDTYRVYAGIVYLDRELARTDEAAYERKRGEAGEWVAARGTKLMYREAIQYFPQIPEGKYQA